MVAPIIAAGARAAVGRGAARQGAVRTAAGSVARGSAADGKTEYRVGNVSAFFMLAAVFLLDGLQFLLIILPIPVIGWLLSVLVGMFSLVLFSMWFLLLRVNIMGGKKAGMKIASSMIAVVIEILPLLGGLPGASAGVLGMIIASRMEDKLRKPTAVTPPTAKMRMGPRRMPPQAANDNDGEEFSAENDNDRQESFRRAA